MRKLITILIIILASFPYLAYSLNSFVVQETGKIKIEPAAYDPDNDKLAIFYGAPLNSSGEWQTDYGDAGAYETQVVVSDGKSSVSEDILIIVRRKEEPPMIELYSPQESAIAIDENALLNFFVSASDLNKDILAYEWFLDGKRQNQGQDFSYRASYNDAGRHEISVVVSDGIFKVPKSWFVDVKDIDVQLLLDNIGDITLNENEVARLNLPDFDKYGLAYSVSEPIGNDNEWLTTYDDAGSYEAEVTATGNGFSGSTEVEVLVNNIDRASIFDKISNKVINENEELSIILSAADPDNDAISYSAENLPEGAKLANNAFSWKPDFETVAKEGSVDYLLENFKVLNKNFYMKFIASSNDKKVVQNVVITVKDVNRAPILEDFEPISIKETGTIKIAPKVYDLDKDKVKVTYSGFMNSDTYQTTYDDAGTYKVIVTATDGMDSVSKDVSIAIDQTNRAPVFKAIQPIKASEGDTITILLDAYDPDADQLRFFIENAPEDYTIEANRFSWTPGYNTVSRKEAKKAFDFVFVATDGKDYAKQIAKMEISNKNRVPRIVDGTRSAAGKVNEPISMFVKAIDDDNDQLTYIWDFGLVDRYKATEKHQRIFTSPGNKVVKVTVSDGVDEAEHIINVHVKEESKKPTDEVLYKVRTANITYRSETRTSGTYLVVPPGAAVVSAGSKPQHSVITNKAPRIIDYSRNLVARANEPVLMYVKAVDDDGDALSYTWDFGFFDSYKGTQYHQRTFSTTGQKTVKVTISDGKSSVQQTIYVNVV